MVNIHSHDNGVCNRVEYTHRKRANSGHCVRMRTKKFSNYHHLVNLHRLTLPMEPPFPTSVKALPRETKQNLVRDYLKKRPSQTHSTSKDPIYLTSGTLPVQKKKGQLLWVKLFSREEQKIVLQYLEYFSKDFILSFLCGSSFCILLGSLLHALMQYPGQSCNFLNPQTQSQWLQDPDNLTD